MRYRIAGVTISIDVAHPQLSSDLQAALAPFATDAPADAHLTVRASGPRVEAAVRARSVPEVVRHGQAIRVSGADFFGEVTRDALYVEGRCERFPTDSVLKIWLAERLAEREGMVLHGCAVSSDAAAAVFVGDSGAGKSTLFRQCTEEGLQGLSDELCAVTWDAKGPRAHGTPWNIGAPREAPLVAVGVLAHSAGHVLEDWPAGATLRTVLPNTLLPNTDAEGRARAFRAATKLLTHTRTCRLSFSLRQGVSGALGPLLNPGS